MSIWVTSDQHFQNKNIWQKYETSTRPFQTQEEHDNTLIERWNDVVQPDDTVFVLGDFIMGTADGVEGILNRLNGYIYLIVGNHDTQQKLEIYKQSDKIIAISNYAALYHKGKIFVMNHYPVEGDKGPKQQHLLNDGWAKATELYHKGAGKVIYLYGHIHGNAPHGIANNMFHVGVDTNNLTPVLLDDIVEMSDARDSVCMMNLIDMA